MRAIGYVRVSTDEQVDSGAGLEAQRRAIRAEVKRRGWELVDLHEDAGASGIGHDPGREAREGGCGAAAAPAWRRWQGRARCPSWPRRTPGGRCYGLGGARRACSWPCPESTDLFSLKQNDCLV